MMYIHETSEIAKSYREDVLRTRKTILAYSVSFCLWAIILYPCPSVRAYVCAKNYARIITPKSYGVIHENSQIT